MMPPEHRERAGLEDETSREEGETNLQLVYDGYSGWFERLRNPELKQSFLSWCSTTVPFYQDAFGGRECHELSAFPIVGRDDHVARRRSFVSNAFEAVPADAICIWTNGTFSPSLRVALDLPSLFDFNQGSYLRFGALLPDLRASALSGVPTIFVVSDSPRERRTSMIMPGLNDTILRKLLIGRGAESDLALVQYLREARIALLYGKPSVLSKLVDLDRALGGVARIRPMYVVCSGENLFGDDRAELEAQLGCGVLEAYVASEGGMMAVECEAKTGLHVLADQLELEVVDDSGSTHPCGSGELLITNALNWRHAFIRYRIGDRATVVSETCSCGHVGQTIIALPGRERAGYAIDGQYFVATDIASAIACVGGSIKQYQVAAGVASTLVVSWILGPSASSRETEDALAASLRARIPGARFELRRVDQITTAGGKLRRFT